jgi:hypothetical protein
MLPATPSLHVNVSAIYRKKQFIASAPFVRKFFQYKVKSQTAGTRAGRGNYFP